MPAVRSKQRTSGLHNEVEKQYTTNDTSPKTSNPPWNSLFVFTTRSDVPLLTFAACCSVIASLANPAQAFITGKVFDGFVSLASGSINTDTLVEQQRQWIIYLVVIAAASWFFHFLEFAAWMTFGEGQARRCRTQLYTRLSKMELAWYDLCEAGTQAFLSRSQMHIKDHQISVSQPLGGFLSLISTSLVALGQAFYNSWDLTLVTLAGAPLIITVIVYFGIRMQVAINEQQSCRETAQKRTLNAFSNIETVKCFNAEEKELRDYWSALKDAARWYRQIVKCNALQMALLGFLVQSMFVQAFFYGGVLIRSGKKQPAQVITTFFSAIAAFQAIQGIIPQLVVLEKGRHAAYTLHKAMPADSGQPQKLRPQRPMKCRGDIHFRSVTFSYPSRPEQLALNHVNLELPGRHLTFLVGTSGSGKSTIGQLLVRFYEASSGSILLDGEDIRNLDTQWLRSKITLVEQASTLFEGSIAENIALGQQSATKHQIVSSAEFALLQSVMFDLPEGLDTRLGLQAESLSGGQRQRVSLARARLRDTPILILDESTSALDQINRELIMDAVREWRRNKTTIIITHDISQIYAEDYIVVLEHGRVVQKGTRRSMEADVNSAFARLAAGDMLMNDRTPPSIRSATVQVKKRPTSFLTAASVCLDTIPFRGMSLRTMRATPARCSPQRNYSEKDELQLIRPSPEMRTVSQRLQDFVHETGQRAVELRGNRSRRQPLTEVSLDAHHNERMHQSTYTLRQMLSKMWRDLSALSRLNLLIGYFGGTVHAVCSPVFAFVLSKLLALYSQPGDSLHMSIVYSLVILAVAGLDAMHIYTYRYALEQASQSWTDLLRQQASTRLLKRSPDFFESNEHTSTRLAETLDHYAEEMRNLFGRFVIMLYIAAAVLVVSLAWALTTEWKMTLMAISAGPYIFVVANLYTRTTEKWERLSNEASSRVDVVFVEAFEKVRTVRCLGVESYFKSKFEAAIRDTVSTGRRRACWSGFFYGMSTSAGMFATALVFYVGTKLIHDGASVGAILEVFAILILALSNVSSILDYVPQMSSTKAMAQKVLQLAGLPDTSQSQLDDTRIMTIGRVDFRNVSFAYPSRPDALVLHNVDFSITPGTTTAIVGGSGSGKSTIAKLLVKLHQATAAEGNAGRLTIAGRDLAKLNTKALRQITAVVAQSSPLFTCTIKENILYGFPEDSVHTEMDNVMKAAKQAGIYDFISSLPDSFNTVVGSGGMGLSGGQVQRIAIARALVRNPSLLILDEATSALDMQSASLIRETISDLVRQHDRKMTILIITHSREMMEIAEHIIVLDQGCVVEAGGFTELLSVDGHLTSLLRGGAIV